MLPVLTNPLPINAYIGPFDPKLSVNVTTGVAAANTAQFAKMDSIFRPVTVSTSYFRVGTQSGNVEYALWSSDGTTLTRIATTGSFASPGTGLRSQALLASVTLYPGRVYYASMGADNTTVTMGGLLISATSGSVRPVGDLATFFPASTTAVLANLGGNARGFVVTFE